MKLKVSKLCMWWCQNLILLNIDRAETQLQLFVEAYRQLRICAAKEITEVTALVGVLAGGIRASWHADQVQAQRAQHGPGCTLQRLLLQGLLVHASSV